jgi:dynein heavy chain
VSQRNCPPIFRNYPPVAGAIAWARNLYFKGKKPILKFKSSDGIVSDPLWDIVKAEYLNFARSIDNYVTDLFNDWESNVSKLITDKLKEPIIRSIVSLDELSSLKDGASIACNYNPAQILSTQSLLSRHSNKSENRKEKNFDVQKSATLPPYRASFSEDLFKIIKESKYLDKMEFRLPEVQYTFFATSLFNCNMLRAL